MPVYRGHSYAEEYLDQILLGKEMVPELVARKICAFKGLDPDAHSNRLQGFTYLEDFQADIGGKIIQLREMAAERAAAGKKPKANWLLSGGIIVCMSTNGHIFPSLQLGSLPPDGPAHWFHTPEGDELSKKFWKEFKESVRGEPGWVVPDD